MGRTNTTMLKTLLDNKFDPSCAGCPEMPLQAAASGGFVSAMKMLLDWNFVSFRHIKLLFFHFFNSQYALRCPSSSKQKMSLFTRSKISWFFETDC